MERSASTPLEGRGRAGAVGHRVAAPADLDVDADLDRRPCRRRGQAGARAGRRRRDHARRGRRVRRQDRAPVARGGAGAVGREAARQAGQVHRGPDRALHVERARARPAAPGQGRVRRRRPGARAGRAVLARQRGLHPVRADRAHHHLDPAARPVQAWRVPGRVQLAVHQHRDRHAVPRRRPAAGRVRDGADDGRDRGRARAGPGAGAGAQLHPARGDALRPGADLPGRPAADLRLRRLPGRAGQAQGAGRLGRLRVGAGCGGAAGQAVWASGWPATSRAPASGRTRARMSWSRRRARSR